MRRAFLRMLNLVLAPMQIVVTILAFTRGTTFDHATATRAGEPPIIPAGYAFTIWSVIYGGSVLYGIYQSRPSKNEDLLLTRIRPWTASAFTATICWLVAARFNRTGLTVICITWLATSLLPVFLSFTRLPRRLTNAEQVAVVGPLSIYTGWIMLAVFANLSAFLYQRGPLDVVLNPALWAVVMLVVAGSLTAWLIRRSGNVPFALTVSWGLIAILVANLTREYHPEVVAACAVMTTLQIGVLIA